MTRIKFLQTILFTCVLSFLFIACDKEDVNEPGPGTNPDKKISKIEYENGSYQTMAYHADGKLKTIVVHTRYGGNNQSTETFNFVYTGSQLAGIESDFGYKYKYTYNNNLVVKTEIFNSAGEKVVYYDFSYKNGKLWKTDGYMSPPGGTIPDKPYQRYEQEYHPDGNISKVVLYYRSPVTGELEKSNDFIIGEYDNKKNTTILVESNPYLPLENFNPNNPLKELQYDGSGVLQQTETHTYTYDAAGNPLTRKTVTKAIGQAERETITVFHY